MWSANTGAVMRDAYKKTPDLGRVYSESEYFVLENGQRLEFSDGIIELMPVFTMSHQRITACLYHELKAFTLTRNLGEVCFVGVRVRLWPGKYREPDVLFMRAENAHRMTDEYWEGADLVMEVVSARDADRRRDLNQKREEYAQAEIPEYWIVDPELGQIKVLTLVGQVYLVHGEFKIGEHATSKLLPGFFVDVAAALQVPR
jgi:Uma2 family endonuclease